MLIANIFEEFNPLMNHSYLDLITMAHQGTILGLQFFKQGQWVGVEPLLDALIVIPGLQLKVSVYVHIVLQPIEP